MGQMMNQSPDPNSATPTRIILFGCGAMALETANCVADCARVSAGQAATVTDVVSTDDRCLGAIEQTLGYAVNFCKDLSEVTDFKSKHCVIAIGDTLAIKSISETIDGAGGQYANVVHPSAVVAPLAELAAGTIVAPFAYVGPLARVGSNTIINVGAVIGHDVQIGRGAVISPKVDLNGGSRLGQSVFLGAGVVVDPGVTIGDFCKVSSGTVVRQDLKPGFFAFDDTKPKSAKMFHPTTGQSLFGGKRP